MNERIKELAEQARKYARDYVTECKHYGYYMEHNEYELQFEEKFAELIVRECIEQVKPTEHHEAFAQGYLGGVDGLELLDRKVAQIKKHFGVE